MVLPPCTNEFQRRYDDGICRLRLNMTICGSNWDVNAIRRVENFVSITSSAAVAVGGPDVEAEENTLRHLMEINDNIQIDGISEKHVPGDPVGIDPYVVQLYRKCWRGSLADGIIRSHRDLFSVFTGPLGGFLGNLAGLARYVSVLCRESRTSALGESRCMMYTLMPDRSV